jgi:hypothetical protein
MNYRTLHLPTMLFLLIFIGFACSPSEKTSSPSSITQLPATIPPLPTKTPIATSTQTPVTLAENHCFEILPELPSEGSLPGILVLSKTDGLSLLDFSQHTRRDISGSIQGIGISPNRKWLSYTLTAGDASQKIVVESADGLIQAEVSSRQGWLILDKVLWLDNERLWFPVFPEIQREQVAPTLILNPFSGEQKQLPSEYPGIKRNPLGFATSPGLHFEYSSVVYDASLHLAIYPEYSDRGWYITLWDRQSEKALLKIPEGGMYRNLPMWLPDGSRFVVVARRNWDRPREWLEVSQTGELRQLTHFEDSHPDFEIGQYASLSPDGRYLAFGLSLTEDGGGNPNKELLVLNRETLEIFGTCMSFDYPAPVWSPDSQYLSVRTRDSTNKPSDIVVLDIGQGWAANISEEPGTNPMGWLE